jgi:simple sugar transport system permease protein
LLQTLRIGTPYLYAAMAGTLSERAGLIALGLEGWMLAGAFGAAVGSYYTGSPTLGVLAGIAAGVAAAIVYGLACIRFRANQVVVGIASNLLALGVTRFFLRLFFDSSSNSPRVAGFDGGGGLVGRENPLVPLALLLAAGVAVLLYRTPFGLRLRAVGEKPEAAASLGISPARIRWIAVLLAGLLASLGGAYLALEQHQFTDGMTAGRGFIALAAVIFGNWRPGTAAVACFFFAAAETLQIQLQALQALPSQFLEMLPYVLTIVALAGLVGRAVPPAALGRTGD